MMDDVTVIPDQGGSSSRLDSQVIRAFASGAITWHDLRGRFGVEDFTVVLRGLAAERLRLPRAAKDRPTPARAWLREVLERAERS